MFLNYILVCIITRKVWVVRHQNNCQVESIPHHDHTKCDVSPSQRVQRKDSI